MSELEDGGYGMTWEHVAVIAAHDAECAFDCGDSASTYAPLTKRERAIVRRLRELAGADLAAGHNETGQ